MLNVVNMLNIKYSQPEDTDPCMIISIANSQKITQKLLFDSYQNDHVSKIL